MRKTTSLQELPELAQRWCAQMGLQVRCRFEASGDEEMFPNRMVVEGHDASWLLSGRAQSLDALQYLLHEAQGERDEHKLVYLDAQGARLFRMRELVAMAGLAAQKARQFGSYTFATLTPRERRWVHLCLSREADIATESEGTGTIKSLKVLRKA